MALVRVLKPLRLTPCSRLNTPQELRKTLDGSAKGVIAKSVEIESGNEMDYITISHIHLLFIYICRNELQEFK